MLFMTSWMCFCDGTRRRAPIRVVDEVVARLGRGAMGIDIALEAVLFSAQRSDSVNRLASLIPSARLDSQARPVGENQPPILRPTLRHGILDPREEALQENGPTLHAVRVDGLFGKQTQPGGFRIQILQDDLAHEFRALGVVEAICRPLPQDRLVGRPLDIKLDLQAARIRQDNRGKGQLQRLARFQFAGRAGGQRLASDLCAVDRETRTREAHRQPQITLFQQHGLRLDLHHIGKISGIGQAGNQDGADTPHAIATKCLRIIRSFIVGSPIPLQIEAASRCMAKP